MVRSIERADWSEVIVYFLIAAAAVAGIAAWTDGRTGHIPNWLTFGALALGIGAHVVFGFIFDGGWTGALTEGAYSLVGALACALVPALFYWKGGIGGGDVKLFAALGALCHPMAGLEVETYAFVAAAIIAPAKLAYQGVLWKTLGRSLSIIINPLRRPENRREIPPEVLTWFRLGPAIFVGAMTTILLHWNLP